MNDLRAELELATRLAREAGAIAMRHFRTGIPVSYKAGAEPVTAADQETNAFLVGAIAAAFPQDAILAEESEPDPRRFDVERTWMVDPIDGTAEFVKGNEGWEVLIGLVVRGKPVLGAVYNPVTGTMLDAVAGGGAFLTRRDEPRRPFQAQPPQDRPLVLVIREGQYRGITKRIADALGAANVIEKGGLGARAALAAEAEADLVLHIGGTPREWDTCALQCVIEEAGGLMLNCLGERPTYLKEDPTQRHGAVIGSAALVPKVLPVIVPMYREYLAEKGMRAS